MATISGLQKMAEKYATKLGIDTVPALRWASKEDVCHRRSWTKTHTHATNENGHPRGTICLERKEDSRGWRWLIAHEVTHLKVLNHSSAYFSRWMELLGVALPRERQRVRIAGLKRCAKHEWRTYAPSKSERRRVTKGGLEITMLYPAVCRNCHKQIG